MTGTKLKPLVFLGGTCGTNNWRERFIAELKKLGLTDEEIFNPVVAEWNEDAQAREEAAKEEACVLMFYIGDPGDGTLSAYSMVEATMALYDKPDRTVVVFDDTGLEGHAAKAMKQVQKVLLNRGLGFDEGIFRGYLGICATMSDAAGAVVEAVRVFEGDAS